MKKLTFVAGSVVGIALLTALFGCGGGAETKTQAPVEAVKTEAPAQVAESPYAAGEKIYKEKCIVCHQANGEGIPGAFPPLAQSDYLLADKVRAVAQALNGSSHEIVVNGKTYNAPMPPQVNTKEEAVAVINYVLNSFGNNGGTVSLEEVKDVIINPR